MAYNLFNRTFDNSQCDTLVRCFYIDKSSAMVSSVLEALDRGDLSLVHPNLFPFPTKHPVLLIVQAEELALLKAFKKSCWCTVKLECALLAGKQGKTRRWSWWILFILFVFVLFCVGYFVFSCFSFSAFYLTNKLDKVGPDFNSWYCRLPLSSWCEQQ